MFESWYIIICHCHGSEVGRLRLRRVNIIFEHILSVNKKYGGISITIYIKRQKIFFLHLEKDLSKLNY